MNARKVVIQIVSIFGPSIYLDEHKFCSAFDDFAPEMTIERKVVRRLANTHLLSSYHDLVIGEKGSAELGRKVLIQMLDEEGFSESWKQIAIEALDLNCASAAPAGSPAQHAADSIRQQPSDEGEREKLGGNGLPRGAPVHFQNSNLSKPVCLESELSFEQLLDASIKTLSTGDTVTGTVVAISTTEVRVDLGTKHAGYIPCDEVCADPNVKPEDVLHVGDEIKAFVVHVNDQEGTVQLSRKTLDGMRVWKELQEAADNKTPVEAKITETKKGGLVANYKGVRVFIPASASGVALGGNSDELNGKMVRIRITEVNRERCGGRVVGSIRAVQSEERKAAQEKIWSEIEVGKKYTGVVKSLTSYGAFVDIGGVEGMVHVSELSWRRIKNPVEVVKVGDVIDVYVIALDPEKKKISLSCKTAELNPWNQFTAKYNVGDVAKVKIIRMMSFGAFAEIVPGVDGLIHISQIAGHRIGRPEDVLTIGQEVDAKIIDIDVEHKRIILSLVF